MATCQSNRVVGYARVSTSDQNTSMQLRAFERAGVLEVHEEQMSAVKSRPVLDQLLAGLKRGDTLVVYKLDRLARSMTQFVRVFEDLRVRGIEFRSLTESIETSSPHGRMFLHMLGAFAEFERELIRERCLAGQRAARAAGKPGGASVCYLMEICIGLHLLGDLVGMSSRVLAEMFGVSISSLRDYIHRAEGRGRWWKKHAAA